MPLDNFQLPRQGSKLTSIRPQPGTDCAAITLKGAKMRYLMAAMLLFLPAVPLTAGTSYFAQVVDGGGYTTIFTIMNPISIEVSGTLSLRDGSGNPWSFSLTDGRMDSQYSFTIPAFGSIRLASAGVGEIKTGWAMLNSQFDIRGVEAFNYRPGSVLQDSVGVVGIPSGEKFILPVDTSSETDTGFAVVNAGTTNTTVQLLLRNEDGSILSSILDPRLNPLPAQNYLCLFASGIFPILKSGTFKGSLAIEVIGSGDIAAMGLSFREGQLSSVPIVDLAQVELSSREKAQKLLGSWTFTYTIISEFTDLYSLSFISEDPKEPGVWKATGNNQYGYPASAHWDNDLGSYYLICYHSIFDTVFTFDFTGPDSVAGLYYQYREDGTISAGYRMTGVRSPSKSIMISDAEAERQSEIQTKALSEARSLSGTIVKPDPALLRLMERSRNRRGTGKPH